jgi:hypothetical protein
MKNKPLVISIVLILMLSTIFPLVDAQTTSRTKTTYAYIGATPNPAGVGDEVLLHVGVTDYLEIHTDGWEGLTVTVTKPDGTTETLGPFRTDSTGGTGTIYVPTMTGTYHFQTHFPAQWFNWSAPPAFSQNIYGSIYYKESSSEKLAVVVTEEKQSIYPASPLPTEYWTRPINAQHREWSSISGNWVAAAYNLMAPYNQAPESAHILWTKTLAMGGLAGGEVSDHAYECGDAYEGFYAGSVIIGGRLFYNRYKADGGTNVEQEVVAVDLHTGEELWVRNWNNTRLAFGQVYYFDSFNVHSVYSYLWTTVGTTWNAYDPLNGRWVYGMTNVPAGTNLYGPNGEILRYTINQAQGWMTLWNSSKVIMTGRTSHWEGSWLRNGTGAMYDAGRGIEWNVTIPKGLTGTVRNLYLQDRLLGSDAAGWMTMGDLPIALWAINLKPGQEGQLLFNVSWTPPKGDFTVSWGTSYGGAPTIEDGVFILSVKETRQHYAFSIDTGKLLWGPTQSQQYLDIYGMATLITNGKLISARMGGIVYAYDIKTGNLLWTYNGTDYLHEILWSDNWPIRPMFVSDGKLYLGHAEHSPVDPKPRGAPFICLDVETGNEVWRIDGAFRQTDWGGRAIIGDSIIATMDTYDQRIYAIGKGPTALTVTAPNAGVITGSAITISGTVTDISPGTSQYALKARFPKGVPAVADESMSEWMKYVYLQFPHPSDVTGVPVTIDIIDANGNYRNIGTATSDASGFFSFDWKPDIEGKYTIIATFAGSKSYYPSYAQAATTANQAPSQPALQPTTESSATEMYVIGIGAAIIAVIVIVGLVLLMAIKKRL